MGPVIVLGPPTVPPVMSAGLSFLSSGGADKRTLQTMTITRVATMEIQAADIHF